MLANLEDLVSHQSMGLSMDRVGSLRIRSIDETKYFRLS
jgi:hypothetical protein